MSYILDALRKSESERRQARAPDLGQLQMVYTPPQKRRPGAGVWIALALMLNAGVMAYVFWPGNGDSLPESGADEAVELAQPVPGAAQRQAVPGSGAVARPDMVAGDSKPAVASDQRTDAGASESPTIIVPSPRNSRVPAASEPAATGRVPHLVEMPLSFQKSIPDLTFNSHIFSSDPAARRVMINGHYLRPGDTFSGLVVEQITEEGVVLGKDGQRFRIGAVRDWTSPR